LKNEINNFFRAALNLELHPQKSRVVPLSRGIDFVGFRNYYYFKLLRKRNLKNMMLKIKRYRKGRINKEGWNAYAKWAGSFNQRKCVVRYIFRKQNNENS
jgi:hypothetical protein